ncbi:MAG: crossover junction endodeoxyribonuclease RuvC [Patescibacteria group bacterium]|nr:crossover junction endodeoxyribonuclease RuvC [Patescibacteria group bacterium]
MTKLKTNNEKLKTIIAIDPGYGRCGWAMLAVGEQTNNEKLKTNNLKLLACDCIETEKNKSLPQRLSEIYQAIEYLIKKYKPQELAIEELFFFKNQKTALQVAQARGAIIVCAQNHGLDIYQYTPLQVKQAVVGYGRGDKKQVQQMLKFHLQGQTIPVQDDTADAVAVGLTHLQTNSKLKTQN